MSAAIPAEAEHKVDARPVRPTSSQTLWDRAAALRDRFAIEVRETLEREGIDAAVIESPRGTYPPSVRLEAWLPHASSDAGDAGCERAELELTIETRSYHEQEIVVSARLTRGKRHIAVAHRPEFPTAAVAEWTRYAIGRGPRPWNYTPVADAIGSLFATLIPFLPPPHHNRVLPEYRTWLSSMAVLVALSAFVIFMAGSLVTDHRGEEPPIGSLMFLLFGVAGLITAAVVVGRRARTVAVKPQSAAPPRNLGLVDSWHVVVADLGRDFDNVQQRILHGITHDTDPGVTSEMETYTQRSPNGYEQRERLVIAKDQGMVHVHIYRFGNDLFVGWHAYLNWAQWEETAPISLKTSMREQVEFRDLRPGVYIPNQFDLIDLSSLSEFVHRRLEREVRALMKERAIDQEIDFKIIRGDRDRALDKSRHTADSPGMRTTGWRYKGHA